MNRSGSAPFLAPISFSKIRFSAGTPTERTEVRFAYDRDNLYMGVYNFDSEPDRMLGNTMKRDEFLGADDRLMWVMDTFLDQQTGYFFEMNPSGLMADSLMAPGGGNREWDGIWNAKVLRSEVGWTIELTLPFRTMNFDPDGTAWGVNFQRTIRRKNEENLWTGHQRNQGLRRLSNAGLLLLDLSDVSQGLVGSTSSPISPRPDRSLPDARRQPRSPAVPTSASTSSTTSHRDCART